MGNRRDKIKKYAIGLLFIANAFIWYAVFCEDRRGILTVSFLNVGQGDAIFIDAPNGNQILLDGGPDKSVLRELGKVMPFYDRGIDIVALSHPHNDHLTGLVDVVERYSALGFLSPGVESKNSEYQELQKNILENEVKDIVAKRGMKIDLGEDIFLEVLLPEKENNSTDPHSKMAVYRLVYGKTSILLTGDMEKDLEKRLVSFGGLKSDILKVGHHGSKNATGELLLGTVEPRYAIISVGKQNKYGHPAEDTIDALSAFSIPIFRTDELGTITIKSNGEDIFMN